MSGIIVLFSLLSLIFGRDEAEIVFAGDAMMHRDQIERARSSKDNQYDFSEYFTVIEPYISSADYAVVNLETPLGEPPYTGYPMFNAPTAYADALKQAGFDLFLTANNHTLDRFDKGLTATIDSLDARSIRHIGTYKSKAERDERLPFIRNINGIKIGFVNYTYGTNGISPRGNVIVDYIDRAAIRQDIEDLRNTGAEIIFACMHWGLEYQMVPHKTQKDLADYLHSLGVEAVIGSHPHVVQPMELTDDDGTRRLTVFSLGNLISNMKTRDTRGGALLKVVVKRNDEGKAVIDTASYRLVFTEPPRNGHNFRLQWADDSERPEAKAFAESARRIFDKYNINVKEELPFSRILCKFAPQNTKAN